MGQYDGGMSPVDSSNWVQPVSSKKDGAEHPAPAPMKQTEKGMVRDVTPDPYGGVARNFGRQS